MGLNERDYYREDGRNRFRLAIPQTVVMNLILVNVGIFFFCWFTGEKSEALNGESSEALNSGLGKLLALTSKIFDRPWEVWRVVSYGFARADLWHLIFNMYGLFLFGRDIESRYGKWEFLRVYMATVLFGGLVWMAGTYAAYAFFGRPLETIRGDPTATVIGASGGVIGVTILFCLNFPRRELLIMAVLPVQAWILGLVFVAIDVGRAVFTALGREDNVAFQVHLAGAVFAAAYFWLGLNFGAFWPGRTSNIRRWFQRKPRLRVHSAAEETRTYAPRAQAPADDPYDDLDRRADEVLRKLHESGEESLTAKERRLLEEYSRRMRQKHR